jgi:hypothetical protein
LADCCCLCYAIGERRPGRIRGGIPLALCAEHRARLLWQARGPRSVNVSDSTPYELAATASALAGDGSRGLRAGLVAPNDNAA